MISGRLVHLIEAHGEEIINRVVLSIQREPEMAPARALLVRDLRDRGQDVLQRLGHWLSPAGKEELGIRYERLGKQFFEEHVPLDEALRGLFLVREKALDYLEDQLSKTSVELYAEEELDREMARFFDLLTVHIVRGYEKARSKTATA